MDILDKGCGIWRHEGRKKRLKPQNIFMDIQKLHAEGRCDRWRQMIHCGDP